MRLRQGTPSSGTTAVPPAAADPAPAGAPVEGSGGGSAPPAAARPAKARHTRASWAWTLIVVAVLLGVAFVDFLVQNTRSARIEFFSVSGNVPIIVALIVAALCGAAIAVVIGVTRLAQLRLHIRRTAQAAPATGAAPAQTNADAAPEQTNVGAPPAQTNAGAAPAQTNAGAPAPGGAATPPQRGTTG